MEQQCECPKCKCVFRVEFVDYLIEGDVPDVKFCPNCGCDTVYDN